MEKEDAGWCGGGAWLLDKKKKKKPQVGSFLRIILLPVSQPKNHHFDWPGACAQLSSFFFCFCWVCRSLVCAPHPNPHHKSLCVCLHFLSLCLRLSSRQQNQQKKKNQKNLNIIFKKKKKPTSHYVALAASMLFMINSIHLFIF